MLRGPSDRLETAPSVSLAGLGEVLDQVRGAGLPVDFQVVGTPGPLSPGVDLTAYRIVQEALTNTIRHARAARAEVTLVYEPGFVTVSVTDSGRREEHAARGGACRHGPRTERRLRGPDSPARRGRASAWPGSRSGSPRAADS